MKLNLNQCNTKTISFTETQIHLKTKIKHFSISKIKKKDGGGGGAAVLTDGCDALLRPSALLSMASSARDRHKNTHIIENKGN